ncbi:MAG TPA: hypothetical protein VFD43_05590, partial [Planctomycetota bacterium]|nr:hypothetical protein [Planctomycetota bacterium]
MDHQGAAMLSSLSAKALVSFLLVLPFMILELTFNTASRDGTPAGKYALDMTLLFGILWLLPLAF